LDNTESKVMRRDRFVQMIVYFRFNKKNANVILKALENRGLVTSNKKVVKINELDPVFGGVW